MGRGGLNRPAPFEYPGNPTFASMGQWGIWTIGSIETGCEMNLASDAYIAFTARPG